MVSKAIQNNFRHKTKLLMLIIIAQSRHTCSQNPDRPAKDQKTERLNKKYYQIINVLNKIIKDQDAKIVFKSC